MKPVMNRLKQTLIGAGALLATATAALVVLSPVQDSSDMLMFPSPRHTSEALTADSNASFQCLLCSSNLLHWGLSFYWLSFAMAKGSLRH